MGFDIVYALAVIFRYRATDVKAAFGQKRLCRFFIGMGDGGGDAYHPCTELFVCRVRQITSTRTPIGDVTFGG